MRHITKIFAITLLLWTVSYAAVPHLINYQGRLTDSGGTPLNGSYSLTFRIYDAETAGNLLWEETHSGAVIQKGIFGVMLGSVTALNLAFDKPYFLEIKVGAEVMSPRQRITSAGYAIRAESSEQAEKVKVDNTDTTAGYLSDKVDNITIKVDTTTHKISAISLHGSQIFTSNGTFTVPMGVTTVYLSMCGGGGGGATISGTNNVGGGGGGGESVVNFPYTVVGGNNYIVTVGAGGAASSAGGDTIFDFLTVLGGSGGGIPTGGSGGGTSRSGSEGTAGKRGEQGGSGGNGSFGNYAGGGGGSLLGRGATGQTGAGDWNGTAATEYGGGGSGSQRWSGSGTWTGGAGYQGVVLIQW